MATYLVPRLQSVYTTLQQNILDKLSTIDSNSLTSTDVLLTSFTLNLYCDLDKFVRYLDASVTANNGIRTKVDQKLPTILNDIAAKESEIARTNGQILDVNAKIQTKRSQISAAEQSVRQAESSIADAQNALQRAEQEVEDAKLCAGLFGRRKRFLGNLWNSIQTSVIKPIESAINTAGDAIVDNIVKPVCSVINFQQERSRFNSKRFNRIQFTSIQFKLPVEAIERFINHITE